MNTLKASVLVVVVLVFTAGCQKKEEAMSLPPDQILSGNAILAPQSVTLEAHTTGTPVNGSVAATTEPSTLELSGPVSTDKPNNKDIQQALKNAGVYTGPVDGSIGPKSKKAIRDFQTQSGLSPDGKVGARTWKKLSSYLRGAHSEAMDSAPISN